MLTEITRRNGYVIFEVAQSRPKGTTVLGYRLFPVLGIGDARRGMDFSSASLAEQFIPTKYRMYKVVGCHFVYKAYMPGGAVHYRYAKSDNRDEIALCPPMEVEEATRMAALANSRAA